MPIQFKSKKIQYSPFNNLFYFSNIFKVQLFWWPGGHFLVCCDFANFDQISAEIREGSKWCIFRIHNIDRPLLFNLDFMFAVGRHAAYRSLNPLLIRNVADNERIGRTYVLTSICQLSVSKLPLWLRFQLLNQWVHRICIFYIPNPILGWLDTEFWLNFVWSTTYDWPEKLPLPA